MCIRDRLRTLLLRLPDRLRRLHPRGLGQLVLGKYDAVARRRIAAYRHGHLFQRRVFQTLHARIEIVQVAVQDRPHPDRPLIEHMF